MALIANRVRLEDQDQIVKDLQTLGIGVVAAVPDDPILSAPTVRALAEAVEAPLVLGTDSWLDHESLGLIIAAMSLPNVLPRLRPDITVIAAERPGGAHPRPHARAPVRHLPAPGRHRPDRRLPDPGVDHQAVRRRA